MALRVCICCEKWWDVEIGKKPGVYRKRCKDELVHDFVRHMPPRESWKQRNEYCLLCRMVTPSYLGPNTGKWHKNCC